MPYGDSEQRNLEGPPGSLLIAVWAISIPSRSTKQLRVQSEYDREDTPAPTPPFPSHSCS